MFMWLIGLFYLLTGSMRIAFLLPSLLAALGTVALVYDLARRLWDRQTAFRAGLLLLFTAQFTLQAKTAQIDALVTFFITLGLYGFLRFLQCGDGWRWYYLGWFAAGLGIITKGVGIIAALVLIPAIWTHWQQLKRATIQDWLKGLAGPLCMLAAISLWLVPMLISVAVHDNPIYTAYRDNILFRQTVTRYANAWHHVKPFWYYLTDVIPAFWLPLSLLLPWLVWRAAQAVKAGDNTRILLVGYFLLVLLFFSCSGGKRGVYITPDTIPLALLTASWLPELLQRIWPKRLLQGLAWLLSLLFLGLAIGLLVSPQLAAKTAELSHNPWALGMSIGLLGLLLNLWLRREPLCACLATLALIWLHYSFWLYPILNDVRTPKGIMAEARQIVPEQDPLLIENFREQFLLFSARPVEHWPYQMSDEDELKATLAWLQQDEHHWALAPTDELGRCFVTSRVKLLGERHGEEWALYQRDALLPECATQSPVLVPFHYVPPQS